MLSKIEHAKIESSFEGNTLIVFLSGSFTIHTVPKIWKEAEEILKLYVFKKIIVDGENLIECEVAGISLLFHLKKISIEKNFLFETRNLQPRFEDLLSLFSHEKKIASLVPFQNNWYTPERVGFQTSIIIEETKEVIEFLGETLYMLFQSFKKPKLIKWNEVLHIAERAGVNAIPIIILIGFLFGLIMSFQSAIPMQKFGAEIYVANLVALSLFRELGPLMTSVILAGRTGSSFAAEIGTMKVSEEVDAIITMGLSPLQFLVIPRIIAAIIVTPMLTIFFNIAGLLGSMVVILSFNYPLVTFINQVLSAVKNKDMLGGLFKATVFGLVIAGIGCFHGLNTKTGASSVGESTTRSVVNGIISIAVLDGIFSVLFFYLGL